MGKYTVTINWCPEEIVVLAKNKEDAEEKVKMSCNMFPDMDLSNIETLKIKKAGE